MSPADGTDVEVPDKKAEEGAAEKQPTMLGGLGACCLCLMPFLFIVWGVFVVWILWDTHDRGAGGEGKSLEACPDESLIWRFLVWFFALGLALSCCLDAVKVFLERVYEVGHPGHQSFFRGFNRVALVLQVALGVYWAVRGTWTWQHMPPTCEKVRVRGNVG